MTLPLRGVTALSLSIYLKYNDITSELLSIMKQTRQIGKETKLLPQCRVSRQLLSNPDSG